MVVLQHLRQLQFPANFKALNFKNESIIAISPNKHLLENPLKSRPNANGSSCTSITTSTAPASSAVGPMCSQHETSLRSYPQGSSTPRHASTVEPVGLVFAVILVGGGGESDRREWVSSTGMPKDVGLSQLAAFPVMLLSHRRHLHRQTTCVDLLIKVASYFFP